MAGKIGGCVMMPNTESGCIAVESPTPAIISGAPSDFLHVTLSIQASRSSSIFGTSDTVMPESVDMVAGLYLGRPA